MKTNKIKKRHILCMANCVFYSERWKLFIELMSGTVNDFSSGFLIFLWCCYDVGFTFLKNS